MATFSSEALVFIILINLTLLGLAQIPPWNYSRRDFPQPPRFVFGAGTSSLQVEGAEDEDGRTPSTWDKIILAEKNRTGFDGSDGYHKYKEDVQLMAETGLEAYRFSISWSRLIPNGRGPVNPKGLQYYNNLINELTTHGIQPHVTLLHYDSPQALEDEYGGWLSRKIVRDFTAYADVCFREFGDRVSHWTTINEANIFAMEFDDSGQLPQHRCSPPSGVNCKNGNSSTERYVVAHNCLLAHASTVRLYKEKYQAKQQGFVGFSIFALGLVPSTNSPEDVGATRRAKDFHFGWLIDPLVFGDYPDIVKKNVGSRIPRFTPSESTLVKGSYDFFGLNYYLTAHVTDAPNYLKLKQIDFGLDTATQLTVDWDGSAASGFPVENSPGLQGALEYFKQRYSNPPIYIQENGQITVRNSSLNDETRVKYLMNYIGSTLEAIRNGSNIFGYFSWSFIDVFELLNGFESSYGLYYVDLNDPDLKRYPKLSAHWYSNFLKGGSIRNHGVIEVEGEFVSLV